MEFTFMNHTAVGMGCQFLAQTGQVRKTLPGRTGYSCPYPIFTAQGALMIIPDLTRRHFGFFAAGMLAAPLPGAARAADLSLDEIISRHTKARGGRAALDAIQAEYVDQDITENGSTVNAHYLCDKQPAFRIDIYAKGKHTFCEGLDAKGPWIWPQDQPAARDGVADGAKSAIQGIQFNLYGLHAFPGLGNRLSLEPRQTIAGTNYYVIGVNMRGSYQTYLYLDPDTFLVMRRRDDRAPHPDLNATRKTLETQYFNFRPVSGVMVAYGQRQLDLASGAVTQTITSHKIAYDPLIPAEHLDRSYRPN
jgi:hypothetical protein